MTKFALAAASVWLVLAGTTVSSAQTTPAPIKVSVVPETIRAGGAAGYPAQPGLLDRLLTNLGLTKTSDDSATGPTTTGTQTPDAH